MITATGCSDKFTQDAEDAAEERGREEAPRAAAPVPAPAPVPMPTPAPKAATPAPAATPKPTTPPAASGSVNVVVYGAALGNAGSKEELKAAWEKVVAVQEGLAADAMLQLLKIKRAKEADLNAPKP